jgi:hypothetical protein
VARSRRAIWSGAGLFVLGALVASIVASIVSSSDDSSGVAIGSAPITLPAKVGDYRLQKDIKIASDTKGLEAKNAAAQQREADQNATRLSKLHRGAATAVTTYATADLRAFATITAIRTRLDPLYVYQENPARVGLVQPEEEAASFGDVSCIVHNQPTPEGGTPDPTQSLAEVCQRSGTKLTVQVRGAVGVKPAQTAALTDQVFDALN